MSNICQLVKPEEDKEWPDKNFLGAGPGGGGGWG